jgi:2-polyprenyl-6-hydroxyphenyl methylase/3-demethylubiquinone-9 3-methyltransferase
VALFTPTSGLGDEEVDERRADCCPYRGIQNVLLLTRRERLRTVCCAIGNVARMAIEHYYEQYWDRAGREPYSDPRSREREMLLWARLGTRSGKFVEVGCGEGHIAAEAARRGWTVAASDISRTAITAARSRYPSVAFECHSLDIDPWPTTMTNADVVAAFEVIEHIFAPRRLVQGAYEALNPGGILVLSTPYHGVLKNIALALHGWDNHFDVEGQHIRFFSDAALRKLLADVGFVDQRFTHLGRTRWVWENVIVCAQKPLA